MCIWEGGCRNNLPPILAKKDPVDLLGVCDEIVFVLEGVGETVKSSLIRLLSDWQVRCAVREAVKEVLLRERFLLCPFVNFLEAVIQKLLAACCV